MIGVSQGSVLFLIYINDLVYSVDINSCLFANEITISVGGDNLSQIIVDFSNKLIPFIDWAEFNQLTIYLS